MKHWQGKFNVTESAHCLATAPISAEPGIQHPVRRRAPTCLARITKFGCTLRIRQLEKLAAYNMKVRILNDLPSREHSKLD